MNYPLLKPHDPDGTRLRTLLVLLDSGDSLLGSTTLVPVDESDVEIVGGDLSVELITLGLISSTDNGDMWGVDFKLHGGGAQLGSTSLIRLRPYLASQPAEPAYDQTYRVPVQHT